MSQNTVDALNNAGNQINIYGNAFICVMGLFGNTVNIILFLTKLKDSVCSRYLLAIEVSNQINLLIFYIPLVVKFSYGKNGTESSVAWCRLWNFVGHITSAFPTIILPCSSIDRFLCSSRQAGLRQWSSLKVANRTIACVLIISFAVCIPDLIYWYIDNTDPSLTYCSVPENYVIYAGYFLIPVLTIVPPLFLAFFGYKTVRNLQTIKTTTIYVNSSNNNNTTSTFVTNNNNNTSVNNNNKNNTTTTFVNNSNNTTSRRQQIDNQLARMVVVQTVVYVFEAMPFAISFAYTYITIDWTKTEMQQALENVFTALGNVISSLFIATTFYIYYIQSAPFRHNVKRLFGMKSGRVENARGGGARVQLPVVVRNGR